MSKELEFFSFLLEQYAHYKNTTADKVLHEWDNLKLTDKIFNMYEMYHSEDLQNAFDDIDRLCTHSNGTNNILTASAMI